ncbi:U6 snRNA phosphodiesterase Usb1 [Lipomyces oligophaga]|uniref:U6 snRNA phosphodiesterase Usb1 n=1 Tax=Lipomyces oligophaga TaxID=45792 RepID=UPI0034CD751D
MSLKRCHSIDQDHAGSASENSGEIKKNSRLKLPPPLPAEFLDLYTTTPRLGDDPAFHQGRTRNFPHERGRWPTHIYLDWFPDEKQASTLSSLVPASAISLIYSSLETPLSLHISLSPTMLLQDHDRSTLVDLIQVAVKDLEISKPLKVSCKSSVLQWLTNPSSTRQFLVLILKCDTQLRAIHEAVISVCNKLGYSSDANISSTQMHISIAWKLTNSSKISLNTRQSNVTHEEYDISSFSIDDALTVLQDDDVDSIDLLAQQRSSLEELVVSIGVLKIKIGNKIHRVRLVYD